jgi:hypothetical protein
MKRTKRSGNRLAVRTAFASLTLLLLAAAVQGGVDGKKQNQAVYALVSGTVFKDTGMAFSGAEVTLAAVGDAKEARKFKKMRVATSPRGEFTFRLPAVPMQYTLSVRASGYRPQEKPVTIFAEDRIDVFFTLEPASK